MGFFDVLQARVDAVNSLLCVGLDPHVGELSTPSAEAAEEFCLKLITETSEFAAAYKPNAAFFEAFGSDGVAALKRVIAAIPDGIPVILDNKRGDISTTAAAYATASFDVLGAHCVTLSPYMGWDSIEPFVGGDQQRGCFVLCKTSNPSANQVQALDCLKDGKRLTHRLSRSRQKLKVFEHVALLASEYNQSNNIGLVVGATDAEALRRVRSLVPSLWILAPGIGAQGGNLHEAVSAGLNSYGSGILLPISRGISKATSPREAAKDFRDKINAVRKSHKDKKGRDSPRKKQKKSLEGYKRDFISLALEYSVLRFGDFTLKSGRKSPYFFNAGLFNTGRALQRLGEYYAEAIERSNLEYDVLFGPAYKGIPLCAAVAVALEAKYGKDVPYAYNRKEQKDHGEGGVLVGAPVKDKRVLLIDDVITAGTAIRESIALMDASDATVSGVVIAIDRQERGGGTEGLSAIQEVQQQYGIPVASIVSLTDLVEFLKEDDTAKDNLHRVTEYRKKYGIDAV